jgi:prepilin-type N-terminal cleavage/methylation domain-containing protein
MRVRGFTLVELLVSMFLSSIAILAIGSVFLNGLRSYTRQIEQAQVRANLRLALATFTRELRGLDSGGQGGSDIVEMNRSSLTYRAHRSTYFLCTQPNLSASTVTVWRNIEASLRQIEVGRDSLLLFAENVEADDSDNYWLPAGLTNVRAGLFCPGGTPGIRFLVQGLSNTELGGVYRGAAVRGFQLTKIRLYTDAVGRSWVGLQELRPGIGWTITQPVLGPVARSGLRFDYYRADGDLAKQPSEVARISIEVVGVGDTRAGAATSPVLDSLTIHVALRNNPRQS